MTTSVFLVTGFSLLITAGVLVYGNRVAAETQNEPFSLSSMPFHVSTLLVGAFVLTLLGSVGVGSSLAPIKSQAGDRVHDPLTYRPGFVTFNHRVLPEVSK
jgi:hypothetical protein